MSPAARTSLGSPRVLDALAALAGRGHADAVSWYLIGGSQRVTRFAYDAIHQDLHQETAALYCTAVVGGRVGVAITHNLERAVLRRTLRAAAALARVAPKQPHFPGFPRTAAAYRVNGYVPATAAYTAAERVERIRRLCARARTHGAALAGSLVTGAQTTAVVNSLGLRRVHASTVAGVKCITMARGLSGFGGGADADVRRLDDAGALERALQKCLLRSRPRTLRLGTYPVLLEPEAVAEVLSWLTFIAFGAKSLQERSSFLAGRFGERLLHPSLTITDDALHPQGLPLPFDCEGTTRQRVVLIDRGVARGVVYDRRYGALHARPSTGHATLPTETEGPLPLHLCIAPGRTPRAELLRRLDRGVFVTRFHYLNGYLDPRQALMTGLTRDGTFWVERGRMVAPLRNLRFTQSIVEAFRHVRGVSAETRLVADPAQESGAYVAPSLLLDRFTFTGVSTT